MISYCVTYEGKIWEIWITNKIYDKYTIIDRHVISLDFSLIHCTSSRHLVFVITFCCFFKMKIILFSLIKSNHIKQYSKFHYSKFLYILIWQLCLLISQSSHSILSGILFHAFLNWKIFFLFECKASFRNFGVTSVCL